MIFDIYGIFFVSLVFDCRIKFPAGTIMLHCILLVLLTTATVLVIVVAMLVNTLDYITGVLRSVFVWWWWGMWVCGGVCVF